MLQFSEALPVRVPEMVMIITFTSSSGVLTTIPDPPVPIKSTKVSSAPSPNPMLMI